MNSSRALLFTAVLGLSVGCGGLQTHSPGDGEDPHDAGCTTTTGTTPPDGSTPFLPSDGGTSQMNPDASTVLSGISVLCTGPAAPVKLNQPAQIACTIDNGGRPTGAVTLSAQPSDGVVLRDLGGGNVSFTLSSSMYLHPVGFTDTTYKVNVDVKDATDGSRGGRGSASVTVLGNLWVGDSWDTGQGIFALGSDGSTVGQAVGPGGIAGVFDLQMLSGGNVIASSDSQKLIRIFDRQGKQQPVTFDTTDTAGNPIWGDGTVYGKWGPKQLALSSTGELWVPGAIINKVPGIAVFNPANGRFLRFVPAQDPTNTVPFESIGRRDDGVMIVGRSSTKTVQLFNEKTYAFQSSVGLDSNVWGAPAAMKSLGSGQMIIVMSDTSSTTLMLVNDTFAVVKKTQEMQTLRLVSVAVSGQELLFPDMYNSNGSVYRFDKLLNALTPDHYRMTRSTAMRGIVKLTQ